MIKPRLKTIAADDEDSPFRSLTTESEATEFERWDETPALEWFGATGDTEAPEQEPEQELDTRCTPSGVGIIGQHDKRIAVSDTTALPYRWICQLWIRRKDSNGKVWETGATGVLVSPRHVLTAAHAIQEDKQDERGQWVSYDAEYIRVTPGRDGNTTPFGTHDVTAPAQVAPGWTRRGLKGGEHDYALLTLDTAIGDQTFKAIGNRKLLYWGSAQCPEATAVRQDPATLVRATGISAGYPNDRGGAKSMFTTSGQLGGVISSRRFMNFGADACQGQSGSPVWVVAGGEYRLVGLLVEVQAGSALVIRITREFATQLRTWMGSASDAFAAREAEAEDTEADSIGEDAREFEFGGSALEEQALGESAFGERAFEEGTSEAMPVGEESGAENQTPPAPVTIGKLAFLTPIAAPLDPGIYDGPDKYRIAPTLQKCLVDAVTKVGVTGSQIALVDLTKDPTAPDFAGFNHKGQTYPASIAKLMPMLAAFQLRSDLRAVQASMPAGTALADVFAEARKRWVATQTLPAGATVTPIAGDLGRQGDLVTWKGKSITLPTGSSLPDLETIFGSGAAIDFESAPRKLRFAPSGCVDCNEFVWLEQVSRGKDGGNRVIKFAQRQKLMIGMSNNEAANSCIADIGFAYIASVLMQTGLWDAARGGGLWLGGSYSPTSWRVSPLGQGPVTATAGSLAALMVLIARDLAVDSASSAAMRDLLKKDAYPGAGTRSGFKDGLVEEAGRRGWSPATVYSKLGLLPGLEYDCAIIERDEGGKHLKYVAVALNLPVPTAIEKLIVQLDQCIRVNNGLP